jgi:hypothetical protein
MEPQALNSFKHNVPPALIYETLHFVHRVYFYVFSYDSHSEYIEIISLNSVRHTVSDVR